jgi:hypothetical protein
MPTEHKITTYTFEELPDKGKPAQNVGTPQFIPAGTAPKERAREWYRQGFWEAWGPQQITDLLQTELSERGLDGLVNDGSPSWSLYTQGSGVAFSGTIDLDAIKPIQGDGQESDETHIEKIKAAMRGVSADDLKVTVTHDSSYTHAHSFDVEVDCYNDHDECPLCSLEGEDGLALATAVTEWLIALSHYLYDLAEKEAEYQESDEQIAESCDANGWLFDATGRPVHHLIDDEEDAHV